jgi:hypothetical protein
MEGQVDDAFGSIIEEGTSYECPRQPVKHIIRSYRLFTRFPTGKGVTGCSSILANSRSSIALMKPLVVYPCCFRLSSWVLRFTGN